MAEDIGFFQVPIAYRLEGSRGVVSIPQRVRLAFRLDPAGGALVSDLWINVPEHDLLRAGNGVAAAYREFRFEEPENCQRTDQEEAR